MYEELVESLRFMATQGKRYGMAVIVMQEAADAIEQLLKVAKKMHLWIFLHSGDEQEAYDWCGLSDEMNAALGYGGQFELRAEPPKEPQIISAVDCKDCRYYPPSSLDGKPCTQCDMGNPLMNCFLPKEEQIITKASPASLGIYTKEGEG